MCWYLRLFSIVLWLLVSALPVAQSPPVPSGHWEGTLQIPDMALNIEIDLAKNGGGAWAGTFGQPAQGVKGLPLSTVAVDGTSIRFIVQGGEAPSTFEGTLADDGQSISGKVTQSQFTIPFTLNRTGDARIAPAPKSPPIGKELEGAWNGALDLGPRQMRIVLTMANQPDGTATGTVLSVDGSGVEIPIAILQKAPHVTIDVPSVGASYAAVLNAAGTELTGTWTQQSAALPLTLRRTTAKE